MHYTCYVIDRNKHEDICNNTEVDCPQKYGEIIKKNIWMNIIKFVK